MASWKYIHIASGILWVTGWKLYIYGNTVTQANTLYKLLYDVIIKYNLTAKIATEEIVQRNKNKDIAWSAMVIYLSSDLFNYISGKTIMSLLIEELSDILQYYPYKGKINGAKSIYDGKIHYRYDLTIPLKPGHVMLPSDGGQYYRDYGPYNIENNVDIVNWFL